MSVERIPRVAIIGRQNVGKSTLLNRLLGAREAIAAEEPGVTRDRIEATIEWGGRRFLAVDTGGYVERARGIERLVAKQAERAAAESDAVILVVDAVTGVQEEDAILARRLQRASVPVLVVANKVDGPQQELGVPAFLKLGLGEPFGVSALHGRGTGDLLDRILELLPPEDEIVEREPEDDEVAIALVGRPNVGKSSLFNRLVGEERSVVYEEAGTTRDAVDEVIEVEGRRLRFVDTAGFRRPSRAEGLDYYGYIRAVRAIDRSHIAVLVVDAADGVTTEDRKIAARVAEAGRGMVVVANKWDLVPSEERPARFEEVRERLEVFPRVPLVRTSALKGTGVAKVLPAALAVHEDWGKRVSTSDVNEVLQKAQAEHPPPRGMGRLQYATQVAAGPPRFVVFITGGMQPPTYVRYLENRLRDAFGFSGVPVRLTLRPRRGKKR